MRGLVVSASSDAAMLERGEKNRLGVSEAASLHAVQGGRNRAGDQGGKPRGLMCSSATLAGFSTYPMRAPPWALLDLVAVFLDVLLLLGCCCRRAALLQLAMRQPFVLFKGLTFQNSAYQAHFAQGSTAIIKC
ncbi:hypothetical protein WHW08_28305 [Klebsiella pneumoniae]